MPTGGRRDQKLLKDKVLLFGDAREMRAAQTSLFRRNLKTAVPAVASVSLDKIALAN